MTTFNTTDQIKAYQAIVIKQALLLYAHTGLKANSAYTPAAMLKAASQITGKTFKRGQYTEAAAALDAWLQSQRKP